MTPKKPIVLVALIVSCAGIFAFKTSLPALVGLGAAPANGGKAVLGQEAVPAEQKAGACAPPTKAVEMVSLDNTLRLAGTLASDEKSDVASTANGIVQEVKVERGSMVEKGDVIAIVDPTDAKNTLAEGQAGIEEIKAALGWDGKRPYREEDQPGVKSAKATLNLAKANAERYDNLSKQGAISKLSLDQMHTECENAQQRYDQALHQAKQLYQSYNTGQARLAVLQKAVADTVITAPFSGWVSDRYVSAGERVTTNPMGNGAKIVTLVKLDPLRLVLTVPQQNATAVTPGQRVEFTVEAFPDKAFSGQVKYIGASIERNSRSLTVEAMVPNADKLLRPGFFASANLVLPGKRECAVVPASAIVKSGETIKVYVWRDGKPFETVVAIDEARDDRVYVKTGLRAGDVVVTDPDALNKPAAEASAKPTEAAR